MPRKTRKAQPSGGWTHGDQRMRDARGTMIERPTFSLPAGITLYYINEHDGAPREDDYGYTSTRVTFKHTKDFTVLGMWSARWPNLGQCVEMDLYDGKHTYRALLTDNDFPPY
jgi:hypothetical protein